MSTTRDATGGRRAASAFGLAVNAVLLVLVNGWPGWAAVPFLTHDFATVLPLVNVSLAFGDGAALVVLVTARRLAAVVLDLASAAIAVAVAVALERVFPFDFGGFPGADAVARVVLAIAVAGAAIGFLVQLVRLVALLTRGGPGRRLSAGS